MLASSRYQRLFQGCREGIKAQTHLPLAGKGSFLKKSRVVRGGASNRVLVAQTQTRILINRKIFGPDYNLTLLNLLLYKLSTLLMGKSLFVQKFSNFDLKFGTEIDLDELNNIWLGTFAKFPLSTEIFTLENLAKID